MTNFTPGLRAAVLVAALGSAATVSAQDYLGVHLDTQREENLRRHQQAQSQPAQDASAEDEYTPPISGKARHAAMRRHHREYDRIRREKGYKVADQWLADQVNGENPDLRR